MQVAATRGKAIFIDGVSANITKRILGISEINFKALFRILVDKVGNCRTLLCPPMVTVFPDMMVSGQNGIVKQMAGAGFQAVPVISRNGDDDKLIIERISKLDAALVSEIVLLSSDKDYVPVLRAKASQGIAIHWVSTTCVSVQLGERLSADVVELCTAGEFCFTELSAYKREIALVRTCTREMVSRVRSDAVSSVVLTLNNRDPQAHLQLMNGIARLQKEVPGLTYKVTG
jgi:hypothetical protein